VSETKNDPLLPGDPTQPASVDPELQPAAVDVPEPSGRYAHFLRKLRKMRKFLPFSTRKPVAQRRKRRPLLWTAALLSLLVLAGAAALCFWAHSPGCENLVRKRLIARLQSATGARVELSSFHWRPFALEAAAGGLVLHGKEAPGEAPFVRIEELRVQLSILDFWSPRVLLHSLEISRPQIHLIVYADGSTNQPQPRLQKRSGKSGLETFFDLKAAHLAVIEASLHYENRAAAFDFQDRYALLSLRANDLALRLGYVAPQQNQPESYHIETGARDLRLDRGPAPKPGLEHGSLPVRGYLQASLDLTRSAAYLRFLRITAQAHGVPDRSLEISGSLQDFTRPRWQAKTAGELDMRLLDPLTGYSWAPEGIARLDLYSAGEGGLFRTDGSVHIDNGAYIATGVVARGVQLDTHVHADPEQLLLTRIVARLRQGGEIDGDVLLAHWLPPTPGVATLQAATNGKQHKAVAQRPKAINPADIITLPVDGKVEASFKNVALDTILEMVCDPPFQHLGLDTRVNGLTHSLWTGGDVNTLTVQGLLNLAAPQQTPAGMVPTNGLVDGTYYQRDGSVDLRKLEVRMPASQLLAHGHLGAYPLLSPTAATVDFSTGNLSEFDTLLRDLGMSRAGKSGVAALPIALAGQAEFHGIWEGSLSDPHLTGSAKATQLAFELAALSPPPAQHSPQASAPPRMVTLDSMDASGSYSAARIVIDHAQLRQHQAVIAVDGVLTAITHSKDGPVFDQNALLHAHLRSTQAGLEQILALAGQSQTLPLTGLLDARIEAAGPLRSLTGSGWLELNKATVYGQSVARIHAQGSFAGHTLQVASLAVSDEAGAIAASGSFDFATQRFQLLASSSALDIVRLGRLQSQGWTSAGKLAFTLSGSGTVDDPQLQAHARLANLVLGGELLGTLEFSAHSASRTVFYNLSSRLDGAELTAHGQTALHGDHLTQARLDFSRFDIGALLKMAHVQGLSGESQLAGSIDLEGPLSRPEALHGDARVQELAVAVSGVHLHSVGNLHATLSNGRLSLDPLHVSGESTDMHLQGSLSLFEKEKRQLDLAASGTINLELARSLDPDLTASGTSTFAIEAHGPLDNPDLRGRIDFQNGSIALQDLPNGLSQIRGTLEFNQNRLEVKNLTAQSGGGLLSLGGYLSYRKGLFADLTATGKGIRIRYPQGVSSLADASLHLQGTQNSLLLSGDVLITRFAVSPDFDFTALSAQASGVQAFAAPDAPSNHIRLDVHFASSPQLNFQNAYAKLAGDVDLRLRGTVASPSLLGRVSITQGSAILAGTRYELQRGELSFTNPVRIQPSIDLNATAHVEDFDITLGIHGPIDRPTISYRSDPPLPEADVVALLALGRTQNQQRIYTQQQIQSNPTDALLGGALNATVSSRVQKLFGSGSVKVDPNYLGALGNSTSRIIVEEQLGRNLTLTYATNVNSTGQQLLQAEVAINRHVSLLVARDESGIFSMVLKATRRYR
jgi:translocation and assembly module TamB